MLAKRTAVVTAIAGISLTAIGCGGGGSSSEVTLTSTAIAPATTATPGYVDPSSTAYRFARQDCARVGVRRMRQAYGGGMNPERVARAYANGFRASGNEENAYQGCLKGFKK